MCRRETGDEVLEVAAATVCPDTVQFWPRFFPACVAARGREVVLCFREAGAKDLPLHGTSG